MKPLVSAKCISVDFPIFDSSQRSLKKKLLRFSTGGRIVNDVNQHLVVHALSDVSLQFEEGARVGLVGHNGSGKTTLLRVLSGVYVPNRGHLLVRGRIASLLDVTMGLDLDATGFENIYLRGMMEGLKPRYIKSKVDDIAEFSELGEYLNMPVRTYSSGMILRLAFAISTNVSADVLIMDEWLSVGDKSFAVKAEKKLQQLVADAAILVIASHDPELISKLCNRRISLDQGRVVADEWL